MSPSDRARPSRRPGQVVPVVALVFAVSLALVSVRAQAVEKPEDFLPLRGAKWTLVETRDGRLTRAKPVGVFRDSLLLDRPRARLRTEHLRIAREDVVRAWVPRKNARTMALVYGVGGFAGRALLECGLGSTRQDLGFDPRTVLLGATVEGLVNLPLGALIGSLGHAWRQAVPTPADGEDARPFPAWGVSALAGGARATSRLGSGHWVDGAIGVWKNSGRQGSWGFEYGTLSRGSSALDVPAHYDTLWGYPGSATYYVNAQHGEVQQRWAYATWQFRRRFGRDGVRPLIAFGFGDYMRSRPYSVAITDSLGHVTHEYGRTIDDNLGANVGAGLTWGRGPSRPDIELRVHFVHSPYAEGPAWITLEAGLLHEE